MIEYYVNILNQMLYEKRLEVARDEARAANQAKSEFLAGMSHEIRTPLNAVLGMNTIILRDRHQAMELLQENPEGLRLLEKITSSSDDIENAGHNLLSLINQILDFSKVEAGKIELVESNYKLSSILNDVSSITALRAKSKDIEFHVYVDENLSDVYFGDEMRMRLIMQNILTNAIKYIDHGSFDFSVSRANSEDVQPGGILLLKEDENKISEDELGDLAILKENGIQVGVGLGYSQNDKVLYRTLVNEYVLSSDERIDSIKQFSASQDCEQYGIVVHALKSSSRMIGHRNFLKSARN
ncbi:MAG: hypothetical protein IJR98_05735 [Synergistaceae bacterium]|nr:hypothetical protein [Synergistaceae bacterium]